MTLTEIFKNNEVSLREKLSGLSLPKDAKKVQQVISDFLNNLFDTEGEYRQNLTQTEDYILQAAIQLMQTQQNITSEMVNQISNIEPPKTQQPKTERTQQINPTSTTTPYAPISGTALGAAAGALFGPIGIIGGAIAGTAVAIYLSTKPKNIETVKTTAKPTQNNLNKPEPQIKPTTNTTAVPIDTNKLISIIEQICENIDNLLDIYKAQIKKVQAKYENQDKPTLDRNFPGLLESIQSLIGFTRYHNNSEDKYDKKLNSRLEDIIDQLDTQGITVVDYTSENSFMFEQIPSDKATEIKPVFPAFVKDSNVILKGQVFIPQ